MNIFQSVKLWCVSFLIGGVLSAAVTSSFQAIDAASDNLQPWEPSTQFVKNEEYFANVDLLLAKYKEHPLLSGFQQSDSIDTDAPSKSGSSQGASVVTLPGGEQLLGIVNNDGIVFVLLDVDTESTTSNDGVIEAKVGYELPSGYKLVGINASSIVLQFASENAVTVELYQ